MASLTLEKGY